MENATKIYLNLVEQFTSRLLRHLSWDKLGAVDELRKIGVSLVGYTQAWQRPLLWVHLPTDLHVNHFNLLAVLQSLTGETMRHLVLVTTEVKSHLSLKDVAHDIHKGRIRRSLYNFGDISATGTHVLESHLGVTNSK